MSWFLFGVAFLIIGYFTYGRFIEKIVRPTDEPTPCMKNTDGIDLVPLPTWKNMLIELLNIAGIGPVIGVILGIQFGKIALLIIPIGCVFMGAVHDFICGMMSLRQNGANMPSIISRYLGETYAIVFSWIMVSLLLLCVTVFINVPAQLINDTWFPTHNVFWITIAIIFVYYVLATLFSVDAIIGQLYPIFGALLIIGSIAISIALIKNGLHQPEILDDCAKFSDYKAKYPLFPCLFVTIACGIISGFHATQSPIVARTLTSEHDARKTFYGMMILEGIIAMIWASAALAIYNISPDNVGKAGPLVLHNIASYFLGNWMGGITIIAIIILAITSGDTALRSSLLSVAELCKIKSTSIKQRIIICIPLIAIVVFLLWWSNIDKDSFNSLWNYFAWGNQVVSATTLMCGTVWLMRNGRSRMCFVTLLPGMFMTVVTVSFILWTPGKNGQPWGLVPGGLSLCYSIAIGIIFAIIFAIYALKCGKQGDNM